MLNVTNNYISWSSGTARVWDTTVSIGTYYSKGSYTLVSKTVTLTHNSSTGKYSTTVTGALNTTFVSGSCSGTMTLPTIPRMTKIANQTLTIGQLKNITWTRASSSFTHALSYTFGSVTETIGTNLTTSVNFTPSEKLYKEMTTSSSKTGTLTLTTYSNNGNTRVGSSTATLTLKADSSVVQPVLNESYVRDVNTKTIALTGDNNVMISNHSVPFVELNFDTIQYAKVKTITVNGSNLDLPDGVTTEETPDITNYTLQQQLPVATTNTFNIVITDSRSIQTTHIITTDFVDYVPLDCNSNFKRTSPTTGEISANFTGNYFNGSFGEVDNSLNISYAYKIQNEEEYSDLFELVENTDYKINGNMFYSGDGEDVSDIILGERLDYRNVYTLTMYVEDLLTKLVINVTIIKGIPIMWWNSEKVTINGDLFIADENEENPVNVLETINNLKEVNLYENTSGSTGTVTLNDDASNYSSIEIMCGADSVYFSTGKIYSPDGKTIATGMQKIRSSNNFLDFYTSNWTISSNKITFVKASNKYLNDSNGVATAGTNAYVRIYKVVGYK